MSKHAQRASRGGLDAACGWYYETGSKMRSLYSTAVWLWTIQWTKENMCVLAAAPASTKRLSVRAAGECVYPAGSMAERFDRASLAVRTNVWTNVWCWGAVPGRGPT